MQEEASCEEASDAVAGTGGTYRVRAPRARWLALQDGQGGTIQDITKRPWIRIKGIKQEDRRAV